MPGIPRASVIMAIFNAEKYIQLAVKSILNQTFRDYELLLFRDRPAARCGLALKVQKNPVRGECSSRLFDLGNETLACFHDGQQCDVGTKSVDPPSDQLSQHMRRTFTLLLGALTLRGHYRHLRIAA